MSNQERRSIADHEEFFNSAFEEKPVHLKPGETVFSDSDQEMIVASVGSGVILSIYDEVLHFGAAGYVLLSDELLAAFPHFDRADPKLLDKAFQPIVDCIGHLKRHGAAKNRVRVRLIGGSQVPGYDDDRGTKNYIFAREYITRKGLSLMNEDMGGSHVRRIHFFPTSGKLVRRILRRNDDIAH